MNSINRINDAVRTRGLSSPSHTGRYARDKSWEKIEASAKKQWKALLLMIVLPTILAMPFVLLKKGPERWLVLGATGISGLWLAGVFVVLWAGVANTLMGLVAEGYTTDTLRKFGGKRWHLINGMKLKGETDIDHVFIGPLGLIVFETKWSGSRWPMPVTDDGYMYSEFDDAVKQVQRNRIRLLDHFGKVLDGMPVRAVCVLWSGQNLAEDLPIRQVDEVTVVRGPKLDSFLEGLDGVHVAPQVLDRVWARFREHALQRDRKEQGGPKPPRPALGSLMTRFFVYPTFGLAIPAYAFVASALPHQDWIVYVTLTVLLIIGFVMWRAKTLRPTAFVWLATVIGISVYLAIYVLLHTI